MTDFSDCRIPLAQTGFFSTALSDYLAQKEALKPFYGYFPDPKNFLAQIKDKQASFSDETRQRLVEVLEKQYEGLENPPAIQQLKDSNTFTLTTGHQLNIFSGPLYFHYKIMTVIEAAKKLKAEYPEYNFVPVYWMASEDHDIDEIRSFRLFRKPWTWETKQTGAVGTFSTEGLSELAESIGEDVSPFAESYAESATLAEATRRFVHTLYGDQGLVVIDAQHPKLKAAFSDVMEDDLFKHSAQEKVIEATHKLTDLGYSDQIYPRPINFFYIGEGFRERIERKDDGSFEVLNTDLRFSEAEMRQVIQEDPMRLSPNVVLRPLYQEMILPNLSYTGGPAEVAYWFQLKEVFTHFDVPFPILLPRNFVMYLSRPIQKKMVKAELSIPDLFRPIHEIKKAYVSEQADMEFSLSEEKKALRQIFEGLAQQAESIDPSLVGWTKAQEANIQKSFAKIGQRFRKAEEQKHETTIRQIETVKDWLFPDGGLQERKDNVLNFYINNRDFLKTVQNRIDPFDFRFHVVVE